jgi:NAD(P)H-dependent FMN reductase
MSKSPNNTPRIALLSGSTRAGSINITLVKTMAKLFKAHGAKPVIIDLKKYDMPLYNGDYEDEHGVPKATKNLIRRLKSCDGVFIASPEYNGCLPPLLKNTIDWTTRVELGQFSGPVYGIGAATPGGLSGIMVLRQLHFILNRLGATVVPTQLGVGFANTAINGKFELTNERTLSMANKLVGQMLTQIKRK